MGLLPTFKQPASLCVCSVQSSDMIFCVRKETPWGLKFGNVPQQNWCAREKKDPYRLQMNGGNEIKAKIDQGYVFSNQNKTS